MIRSAGGEQQFQVPCGYTTVHLAIWGAEGGGAGAAGGLGGFVQGDLSVTPGEILYVYVGGQAALFNGAGAGAAGGATGGGASDVRQGGNALGNRVAVAGGGGGGGGWVVGGGGGGGSAGDTACSGNDKGGGGGGGGGTSYLGGLFNAGASNGVQPGHGYVQTSW